MRVFETHRDNEVNEERDRRVDNLLAIPLSLLRYEAARQFSQVKGRRSRQLEQ